jgi:hypothetical protein
MLKPKSSQNSGCTHSPNRPKKFKETLSARKLMATVFCDRKGVLIVEFMQQGTTITSEVNSETQAADFNDTGIQKLILRNDKYLRSGGDYVEK